MKRIAKFEKVSREQFFEASFKDSNLLLKKFKELLNDSKLTFDQFMQSVKDLTPEYNDIKLPVRATTGSAGYDFFAPFDFEIPKTPDSIKIPTGIRCKIEEGYVLSLYPRSSLGFKYQVHLNNTVGIIDQDYYNSDNEGHIMIKLSRESDKPVVVKKGEAFAQGIFTEFFITEDDDVTAVRNGGFGSTSENKRKE